MPAGASAVSAAQDWEFSPQRSGSRPASSSEPVALFWECCFWLLTDGCRLRSQSWPTVSLEFCPGRRRLTPQLLLLVAVTFLTSYVASAGEQWSAIYVSDTLRAGAALGASTYTIWVLTSAAGLLVVDRIATRFGILRLFRLSIPAGAAGLGAGLLINTPVAAIAGFAVLGLCSATVGPVIGTLAGHQPRLTAAEGVSVVQLGEPPGFLISPLLIGSLAAVIDLRWALATTVISLIEAALLAMRLRTTRNVTHACSTS